MNKNITKESNMNDLHNNYNKDSSNKHDFYIAWGKDSDSSDAWRTMNIEKKRHHLSCLFLQSSWLIKEWSIDVIHYVEKRYNLPNNTFMLLFTQSPLLRISQYNMHEVRQTFILGDLVQNRENKFGKLRTQEIISAYIAEIIQIIHRNHVYMPAMIKYLNGPHGRIRAPFSLQKECWQFADSCWQAIKDRSLDINYYSKRGILARLIYRTLILISQMKNAFLLPYSEIENEIKTIVNQEMNQTMKIIKKIKKIKNLFGNTHL